MSFISSWMFTSHGAARQRLRQPQQARGLALHVEGDDQGGADLQFRETARFGDLLAARAAGVAQLREPQMLEPDVQPGQRVEVHAVQHFRMALRERCRAPPGCPG